MIVSFQNIRIQKDKFILKADFEIPKGITGIYGPSGAGKTTLLHLLSGMDKPDTGRIQIGEELVYDHGNKICISPQKRKIGYVFQEGRLFPHLSVRKNLLYGYKLLSNSDRKVQLDDIVNLLELEELLDKNPVQLSGGQKQRVAIGRALLTSPKILLLDEPFSALDQALRAQIIPYLIKISKNLNISLLIVSHDISDILKLTDELVLVKDGNIMGSGNYYDLILNKSLIEFTGGSGLLNFIPLEIDSHNCEKGLTILKNANADIEIKISMKPCNEKLEKGHPIKVSMRPEDVAISLNRVEGVSIQNQLKGKIESIIDKDNHTFCVVDLGFKILAEITHASANRMGLVPGKEIWCLFKTQALNVHLQ